MPTARGGRFAGAPAARTILLLAFLLHGIFLALVLPYADPLDEPFHYGYAAYLAQTGRVPRAREASLPADVLRPGLWLPQSVTYGPRVAWRDYENLAPSERQRRRTEAFRYRAAERGAFIAPNYEAQQPPLFYFGGAGILRVLSRSPVNSRLFLLRIFATACAALAIPLGYRFFRRMLPKRTALAACAAFVAFPAVSSLADRFANDAPTLPIGAALLILLAETSRGRLDGWNALALALLLAAGCWTKLSFMPLILAAPFASLLAPRQLRRATCGRATAAGGLAFLLLLPWLARQHRDSGDWFGLVASKNASELGIGILKRIAALPDLFHWRYVVVFGRTFLWPGTQSAMGAPAVLAVALTGVVATLWFSPALRSEPVSPRIRRAGVAVVMALGLFLASEFLYSATFAAVWRARGLTFRPQGMGWYALILAPAVFCAGCSFGRPVPRFAFVVLASFGLVAIWWLELGVLPAVYGGRILPNGSNASFSLVWRLAASPLSSMRTYHSVALVPVSATLLAVLWFFAQALLALGTGLAALARPRAR